MTNSTFNSDFDPSLQNLTWKTTKLQKLRSKPTILSGKFTNSTPSMDETPLTTCHFHTAKSRPIERFVKAWEITYRRWPSTDKHSHGACWDVAQKFIWNSFKLIGHFAQWWCYLTEDRKRDPTIKSTSPHQSTSSNDNFVEKHTARYLRNHCVRYVCGWIGTVCVRLFFCSSRSHDHENETLFIGVAQEPLFCISISLIKRTKAQNRRPTKQPTANIQRLTKLFVQIYSELFVLVVLALAGYFVVFLFAVGFAFLPSSSSSSSFTFLVEKSQIRNSR